MIARSCEVVRSDGMGSGNATLLLIASRVLALSGLKRTARSERRAASPLTIVAFLAAALDLAACARPDLRLSSIFAGFSLSTTNSRSTAAAGFRRGADRKSLIALENEGLSTGMDAACSVTVSAGPLAAFPALHYVQSLKEVDETAVRVSDLGAVCVYISARSHGLIADGI